MLGIWWKDWESLKDDEEKWKEEKDIKKKNKTMGKWFWKQRTSQKVKRKTCGFVVRKAGNWVMERIKRNKCVKK